MKKDVQYDESKNDLVFIASDLPRAANLMDIQLGALTYAPEWGADKAYFLNPDFEIQAECFEAHLLQRMAYWGINVANFAAKQGKFCREMLFNLEAPGSSTTLMRG